MDPLDWLLRGLVALVVTAVVAVAARARFRDEEGPDGAADIGLD